MENNIVLKGQIAHKGKATGSVRIIDSSANQEAVIQAQVAHMNDGDILVTHTSSAVLMAACKKASAIVTDIGGLMSHVAVIARELDKPCIVDTKQATTLFKDGDRVEVDAEKGTVTLLQ